MIETIDFTGVPLDEAGQLINELKRKIEYIASGSRDRYRAACKLAEDFEKWGREQVKVMKDLNFIDYRNTNYSSWEYVIKGYKLNLYVYYTMPYSNRSDGFVIEKEEDFAMILTEQNWRPDKKPSMFFKTIEELQKYVATREDLKW